PGGAHSRAAAHLDAAADAQAVDDAGEALGGQLQVALALQLVPEGVAGGSPSHVARARPRLRVIAPREIGARAPARQVGATVEPRSLDGKTDEGIVGGIRSEAEDSTPERRQAHPRYPSSAARAPR